jgi:hypothetical protein
VLRPKRPGLSRRRSSSHGEQPGEGSRPLPRPAGPPIALANSQDLYRFQSSFRGPGFNGPPYNFQEWEHHGLSLPRQMAPFTERFPQAMNRTVGAHFSHQHFRPEDYAARPSVPGERGQSYSVYEMAHVRDNPDFRIRTTHYTADPQRRGGYLPLSPYTATQAPVTPPRRPNEREFAEAIFEILGEALEAQGPVSMRQDVASALESARELGFSSMIYKLEDALDAIADRHEPDARLLIRMARNEAARIINLP